MYAVRVSPIRGQQQSSPASVKPIGYTVANLVDRDTRRAAMALFERMIKKIFGPTASITKVDDVCINYYPDEIFQGVCPLYMEEANHKFQIGIYNVNNHVATAWSKTYDKNRIREFSFNQREEKTLEKLVAEFATARRCYQ